MIFTQKTTFQRAVTCDFEEPAVVTKLNKKFNLTDLPFSEIHINLLFQPNYGYTVYTISLRIKIVEFNSTSGFMTNILGYISFTNSLFLNQDNI